MPKVSTRGDKAARIYERMVEQGSGPYPSRRVQKLGDALERRDKHEEADMKQVNLALEKAEASTDAHMGRGRRKKTGGRKRRGARRKTRRA